MEKTLTALKNDIYCLFFCWLSDICFSSLTLPHSFFSLWLIPLFSLYISVCRFSTWGWIWGASVSLFWLSLRHSCLSGGYFSHRLFQNGPFPPVSPSFVNLPVERLRPSESFRSCYRLWIAPDLERWLILFFGWCKSISFDSLPSCRSYFGFFFVLTGFLWEFHICHRVCACVCVCLNTYLFFLSLSWLVFSSLFTAIMCKCKFSFFPCLFLLLLIDRKTLSLCCY